MDITSAARISCTRRIYFFASALTSVNHNIYFQTDSVKISVRSHSPNETNPLHRQVLYFRFLQITSNSNSKHDVLTRNPAHF